MLIRGKFIDLPKKLSSLFRPAITIILLLLGMSGLPYLAQAMDSPDHLDSSWATYTYTVITHHVSFGSKYIWTYGPLGFVDNPIMNARSLLFVAIIFQIVSIAILVLAMIKFLMPSKGNSTVWIFVALSILLSSAIPVEYRFTITALILILDEWHQGKTGVNKPAIRIIAIGLLLVLSALVKASMLTTSLTIPLVYTIGKSRLSFKRMGILFLSMAVYWVFGFVAIGQGIKSALETPLNQIYLIVGYASMAIHGPIIYLVGFVLVSIGLFLVLGSLFANEVWHSWRSVLIILLLYFESFKEGFVRQDGHVFSFFAVAMWLIFVTWSFSMLRNKEPSTQRTMGNLGAILSLGICFTVLVGNNGTTLTNIFPKLNNTRTAMKFIFSRHYMENNLRNQDAAIIQSRPEVTPFIPLLWQKSDFAWPWNINSLVPLTNKIDQPPIPQEYSVYTLQLDRIDSNFFNSSSAPKVGLVSLENIDGRLPLQSAPQTFRTLLSRYHPVAISAGDLLIERNSSSSKTQENILSETNSKLNTLIAVPTTAPQMKVFAQISVHQSLVGRLLSLLFRSAPLYITENLKHGGTVSYRLVSQTLKDGLLVSNSPKNIADLAILWNGGSVDRIKSFIITTPREFEWQPKLTIKFYSSMQNNTTQVVAAKSSTSNKLMGHLDVVQHSLNSSLTLLQGWVWSPSVASPLLAIKEANGKFAVLHTVKMYRPDVQTAIGKNVPPMTGFLSQISSTYSGPLYVLERKSSNVYFNLGSIGGVQ